MVKVTISQPNAPDQVWAFRDDAYWAWLQDMERPCPPPGTPMKEMEKWHLQRTVNTSPTLTAAADRLGIARKTLSNRRKEGVIA